MLAVWLTGCGLPPVLTIISSVADGLSFAANGKSLSSVALSAVTDQDCAVYRIVTDKDVCRDSREHNLTVREGEAVFATAASELQTDGLVLEGFAFGTELFALVQDDGTLEVYSHDAARTDDRSNMRLIAQISGYGTAPESFRLFRLNGASIAVRDIIV